MPPGVEWLEQVTYLSRGAVQCWCLDRLTRGGRSGRLCSGRGGLHQDRSIRPVVVRLAPMPPATVALAAATLLRSRGASDASLRIGYAQPGNFGRVTICREDGIAMLAERLKQSGERIEIGRDAIAGG